MPKERRNSKFYMNFYVSILVICCRKESYLPGRRTVQVINCEAYISALGSIGDCRIQFQTHVSTTRHTCVLEWTKRGRAH